MEDLIQHNLYLIYDFGTWDLVIKLFTYLFAVQALQVLYTSLNSPTELTNWNSDGNDPCEESWKGVACEGSAVVSMYGTTYF